MRPRGQKRTPSFVGELTQSMAGGYGICPYGMTGGYGICPYGMTGGYGICPYGMTGGYGIRPYGKNLFRHVFKS